MTTTLDMMSSMEQTIAALTAENARLRGELAAVQPELEAMQARAVALDTVVSEHSALTADLARVTAERDEWRKAEEEARIACSLVRVERDNAQEEKRRAGLDAAAECGRLGMLTAENARVIAERDGLQRALDVSKDTAAGFMSTEQLRVFLGVVRIAIAACAPPASGEEDGR